MNESEIITTIIATYRFDMLIFQILNEPNIESLKDVQITPIRKISMLAIEASVILLSLISNLGKAASIGCKNNSLMKIVEKNEEIG